MLSPVDKFENSRQTGDIDDLELCIMGPDDNHEAIDEDIILEDLKVFLRFLFIYRIITGWWHEAEATLQVFCLILATNFTAYWCF